MYLESLAERMRDEAAEISQWWLHWERPGKLCREFESKALEPDKHATEVFLYLNGGNKFDFYRCLLAIIIYTLFYLKKSKLDGDTW